MAEKKRIWIVLCHILASRPIVDSYILIRETASGVTVECRSGKKHVPTQNRRVFHKIEDLRAWYKRWLEDELDRADKRARDLKRALADIDAELATCVHEVPGNDWKPPKVKL